MRFLRPRDPAQVKSARVSDSVTLRVTRNSAILIAGRLVSLGFGFLLFVYAARYLGVARLGLYTVMISLYGFFLIVSDFGMQNLIVRETARRPEERGATFAAALRIRALPTAVGILLLPVLASIMGGKPLAQAALIAALMLLPQYLSLPLASVLKGVEKMGVPALSDGIASVFKAALGILLLRAGYGLLSLMGVLLAAECVRLLSLLTGYRSLAQPLPRSVPRAETRWLARESVPLLVLALLAVVYYQVDRVMLLMMKGEMEVGLYGPPTKLMEVLSGFVSLVMVSVLPLLSSPAIRPGGAFGLLFRRLLWGIGRLSILVAVVIHLSAPLVIPRCFGPDYAGAVPLLRILGWSFPFLTSNYLFGCALLAVGRQRILPVVAAAKVIFNIVGNLILIPPFGALGAAVTSLSGEVISALLLLCVMKPLLRLDGAGGGEP